MFSTAKTTYTYAYKSSDGVRHEATMEAASREAVFAALRAQGIKAIKVVAADGTKANGEVRGVRRRVVTIVAIAVALLAGVVAFGLGRARSMTSPTSGSDGGQGLATLPTTAPRHQIYGDPVIVEEITHGRTSAWHPKRGDQLLAWFAQPGKIACPKEGLGYTARSSTSPYQLVLNTNDVAAIDAARLSLLIKSENEPREVRELREIVNGIHAELNAYLANGNGTIRSFWRRLQERTREEIQICARIRRELVRETNPAVWEQKNEALRNLGLRTIPNPQEAE